MFLRHILGFSLALLLSAGSMAAETGAALVDLLKNRDMVAARALIAERVDVNTPDAAGMTALHWAAHWNDLAMVQILIDAGANPRVSNRYGVTPLHEAATVGNAAMIEALLKAGADANATYGSGETALMTAARTGNVDAVRALTAYEGYVEAAEESSGQTALMWAAAENHPEVARFLIEKGADVNRRSAVFEFQDVSTSAGGAVQDRPEGGLTALHFAARESAVEVAGVLIESGGDINAGEPQYGFTPMQVAIFNGHYDFAGALLEKGADADDGSLYTLMEMRNLAFFSNRPNPSDSDQRLSSIDLLRLLLAYGADPNQVYTRRMPPRQAQGAISVTAGATPLHRAMRNLDLAAARLLVEAGASPMQAARDGSSPVLMAAGLGARPADTDEMVDRGNRNDPLDAVRLFVAAGVDVVNALHEPTGNTALHYAAQAGSDRVIEYLVNIGARLDARNKDGKTPLEMVRNERSSTAELIRSLMGGTAALGAQ